MQQHENLIQDYCACNTEEYVRQKHQFISSFYIQTDEWITNVSCKSGAALHGAGDGCPIIFK